MDIPFLIGAFVTLFVIIEPVGLAPLFLSLTRGTEGAERRAIAYRACLMGAALLTLFGLLGETVLNFVGISMPAFRIAGGILLFLTALDMLFERRTARRKGQAQTHADPSVFPLATPLIAGPGSMATMILLTGQAETPVGIFWVMMVMVAVVIVAFMLFLTANWLERVLGDTGINVVTRLLGMLLAALSVQFVLDGLASFGLGTMPG